MSGILDPTSRPGARAGTLAPRARSLHGATVGLLNNSKRNSDLVPIYVLAHKCDFIQTRGSDNIKQLVVIDARRSRDDQVIFFGCSQGDIVICKIKESDQSRGNSIHFIVTNSLSEVLSSDPNPTHTLL